MFEPVPEAGGEAGRGGQLIELAERARPPADIALSFAEMRQRVEQLDEFYRGVMQRGTDYDLIPGTPKPTLLQPGAQLLDAIFGLAPIFEELPGSVEDFERGFFAYKIRCKLVVKATGWTAAEAIGSCNSKENRYRWRDARRRCPECGAEAITKGRAEYGGGWLCWKKTGGCGAKYRDGDESIEGQAVGKVENDDPYTLANTLLKMAQKRAHIAATLNATGACYSDDTEVLTIGGWRRIANVSTVDRVATRREDGEIEFLHPIAKIERDYHGPMVAFGGTARTRVDLLVTPNHRMLVRDWRGGTGFRLAGELLLATRTLSGTDLHQRIVRTAIWSGEDIDRFELPALPAHETLLKNVERHRLVHSMAAAGHSQASIARHLGLDSGRVSYWVNGQHPPDTRMGECAPRFLPIDAFLRFLGWYLSEGNVRPDGVEISQAKKHHDNIESIRRIAREMGFSSAYYGHGVRIYSKQLSAYCRQFGRCHEKFVPSWVKRLPPHRLSVLLEALIGGDGSSGTRKGGLPYAKYTTTSRQLADDIQEIAIKAGFSSIICPVTSRDSGWVIGRRVERFRDAYTVTIVTQRDVTITRAAVREVPYHGKVYCLTVPNGTLLVRRNGKYAWCGNSRIFTQDVEDMGPAPVAARLTVEQALATGELNPAELPDAVIAGLARADLVRLARALKAECDALGIVELPRLGPKPSDDEIRAVVREVRDRVAGARKR